MASLPVLDLALPPVQQARTLDAACRSIGFLVVKNHGVPQALLERAFAAGFAFFDAPEALKKGAVPDDGRVRGYTPLLRQKLAGSLQKETPPDLFERFRMGAFGNVWPQGLPGFQEALQEYYRAMEQLAGRLMEVFARALDLPPAYFSHFTDRHISSLCLNHYPALQQAPEPGQLRAGEHTDYGSLTIVAPTDAPGRLQVLTREDGWIEVDPPPGHFVVNIGDLMAQWTNDRWVSTLHRVGLPDDDAGARARRLSLVFFHQPNDDARIECIPTCLAPGERPRYAPVTSGEHLRLKINRHFTKAA